jgi:hypothetical protein
VLHGDPVQIADSDVTVEVVSAKLMSSLRYSRRVFARTLSRPLPA